MSVTPKSAIQRISLSLVFCFFAEGAVADPSSMSTPSYTSTPSSTSSTTSPSPVSSSADPCAAEQHELDSARSEIMNLTMQLNQKMMVADVLAQSISRCEAQLATIPEPLVYSGNPTASGNFNLIQPSTGLYVCIPAALVIWRDELSQLTGEISAAGDELGRAYQRAIARANALRSCLQLPDNVPLPASN